MPRPGIADEEELLEYKKKMRKEFEMKVRI